MGAGFLRGYIPNQRGLGDQSAGQFRQLNPRVAVDDAHAAIVTFQNKIARGAGEHAGDGFSFVAPLLLDGDFVIDIFF